MHGKPVQELIVGNLSGAKGVQECYEAGVTEQSEVIYDKHEVEGETQPKLEIWANAQRDGRPAEHRWRPLFNAAKFG